jgi:hypothetical protein
VWATKEMTNLHSTIAGLAVARGEDLAAAHDAEIARAHRASGYLPMGPPSFGSVAGVAGGENRGVGVAGGYTVERGEKGIEYANDVGARITLGGSGEDTRGVKRKRVSGEGSNDGYN